MIDRETVERDHELRSTETELRASIARLEHALEGERAVSAGWKRRSSEWRKVAEDKTPDQLARIEAKIDELLEGKQS